MKTKRRKIDQDHFWGYLMIAPTILGLIILNVYPFLETIFLSFTNKKYCLVLSARSEHFS